MLILLDNEVEDEPDQSQMRGIFIYPLNRAMNSQQVEVVRPQIRLEQIDWHQKDWMRDINRKAREETPRKKIDVYRT